MQELFLQEGFVPQCVIVWCREVEAAFIPGRTRLLMLETPTNPKLDVCDIRGCCAIARKVCLAGQCTLHMGCMVFQR